MLDDKIREAQDTLKLAAELSLFYYGKPLIITYSGGKDSDVMLDIAKKCLKPNEIEVMNSYTTVDAPETVYHIREVFKQLEQEGIHTEIRMPTYKGERTSMWKLIVQEGMPPTRLARYCCKYLKEASTPNRMVAVGVREDESIGRRGKDSFAIRGDKKADALYKSATDIKEQFEASKQATKEFDLSDTTENVYDCKFIASMKKHKDIICNPIYSFTENDIWEYVKKYDVQMNPLYERGYKRVGCIGCPLGGAKQQRKQFADYPKYKENYIKAFDRMLEQRKAKGYPSDWGDGEKVFMWWMGENPKQMTFDDLLNEDQDMI